MKQLIAVAGFAGSGKTTAVEFLERLGIGKRIYAGQWVLDEIEARGLISSASTEKLVRNELRDLHGPDAIASHAASDVLHLLDQGIRPLLDAILSPPELYFFQNCGVGRVILLGISATFEARSARLAIRVGRSILPDALRIRDEYEFAELKTHAVLARADFSIENNESIADFQSRLACLANKEFGCKAVKLD